MKIDATVTKRAVPSMLTVAPMGRTNLVIRGSTLFFCIHRKVMGSAAALQIQTETIISHSNYTPSGREEFEALSIRAFFFRLGNRLISLKF